MTAVARTTKPQPRDDSDHPRRPLRLLVVDDHPAVRAGLRQLLDDQADFEVAAAVATADEALAVAEREPIDVAVVDYQLGGRNGLWVSRKLKRLSPAPGVLIYSAYTDGVLASAAVVAEADAIFSKGGLGSELCEAIRMVARGHQLLPPGRCALWHAGVARTEQHHPVAAVVRWSGCDDRRGPGRAPGTTIAPVRPAGHWL
jgi:DNA-binding NarL/FixJ family response regulator